MGALEPTRNSKSTAAFGTAPGRLRPRPGVAWRRRSAFVLLAVTLAMAAGSADAQFGGGMGRRGGFGGGDNRNRSEEADPRLSEITRMSANDKLRLRLTQTHVTLKLTPEQAAPWQAFEMKVLALLDATAAPENAGSDTLARIEQRRRVLRARLTAFDELVDATRKLYAVLDEEQKRVADRMLPETVPATYPGAVAAPATRRGDRRGSAD